MEKYYVEKHNELHYCKEENKYVLFNASLNNWIRLDDIGNEIYKAIEQFGDLEKVICALASTYNISKTEISPDVCDFVDYLKRNRFIRDNEDEENSTFFEKEIDVEKYPYNVMMISVSTVCNLDCIYCYNKDIRKEKETLVGKEKYVKEFLKNYKNKGGTGVLFTGGEPLLYKNIVDLCEYSKRIGLKTKVITNTTLLSNIENLEDILFNLDEITLSLDSIEKKDLETLWNTEADIDKIIAGLVRINNYSRNVKKICVTISPIVTQINKDHLDKVVKIILYTLKDCVVKMEPTKYMNIGNEYDLSLSVSDEEYIDAYINACKKNNIVGDNIYRNAVTHNGKYTPYPMHNCYLCKPSFFVKPNGDVYPCQSLLSEEFFLGNITVHSFEQINSKFIDVIKNYADVKSSDCKDCSFRFICPYKGGICRKKVNNCKSKLLRTMCVSVQ